MYRVRVTATPELDFQAPDPPAALEAMNVDQSSATIDFTAPGDDGQAGTVTSYEIRIRANDALTADNFDAAMPTGVTVIPSLPCPASDSMGAELSSPSGGTSAKSLAR